MRKLRAGLALVTTALVVLVAWRVGLFELHDRAHLLRAIERLRAAPSARLWFVAIYATAAAVGVPASPFTLAGGALFGVWWGLALNWLGAMLAAAFGYGLARSLRDLVVSWLSPARQAWLAALGDRRGGRALFRLRLIPVVPFFLLNVGSALAGISWRTYLVATGIGIVPVTVIYTTFASSLLAGVGGAGGRALAMALVSGVGLVGISFAPRLFRRREINAAADDHRAPAAPTEAP